MDAHFLLHFCAIHTISSTSFGLAHSGSQPFIYNRFFSYTNYPEVYKNSMSIYLFSLTDTAVLTVKLCLSIHSQGFVLGENIFPLLEIFVPPPTPPL